MKITKERLRELIKEEMQDLENEGREVGYHLAYASKKQKMDPAAEKERDLKFSGATLMSALFNPMVSDGRNTPAEDNEIDSAINIATDGKDPADIAKIFDFIKANAGKRAQEIKDEAVMNAFQITVSKLEAAMEKKLGGQKTMLKVNEIKIKIK